MKLKIRILEGWNKKVLKDTHYGQFEKPDALGQKILFLMNTPTTTNITLTVEKLPDSAAI